MYLDKRLPLVFASSFAFMLCNSWVYGGDDIDFQEVSEPAVRIGGAYYGLGLGFSDITNKLNVYGNNGGHRYHKSSATQSDISLISGFGTTVYNIYAGIELDVFKRLPKKNNVNGDTELQHRANWGLNMDVRFGYQPHNQRALYYGTFGFARIIGDMVAYDSVGHTISKQSFGSFFPTFGAGVEYKVNQSWNVRADGRISVCSKEKKTFYLNDGPATFEVKPNRYAIRLSVVRSL